MLVYLNENWQPEGGGQLELWRSMDDGPVKEIVPLLNRTVVFSTPDAAHGHPKPITAPAGRSRLCFSAYTSPAQTASEPEAHGVRFANGNKKSSRKNTLRRYLPPVVYDGCQGLSASPPLSGSPGVAPAPDAGPGLGWLLQDRNGPGRHGYGVGSHSCLLDRVRSLHLDRMQHERPGTRHLDRLRVRRRVPHHDQPFRSASRSVPPTSSIVMTMTPGAWSGPPSGNATRC